MTACARLSLPPTANDFDRPASLATYVTFQELTQNGASLDDRSFAVAGPRVSVTTYLSAYT